MTVKVKMEKDIKKKIKRAIGPKPLIYGAIAVRRAAQRSIKTSRYKPKEYDPSAIVQPRPWTSSAPGSPPLSRPPRTVYRYLGRGRGSYWANFGEVGDKLLARPGWFINEKVYKLIKKRHPEEVSAKKIGKGYLLRRAIAWDLNRQKTIARIGPAHSEIGNIGAIHERGLIGPGGFSKGKAREKTTKYPKRPFMVPALKASKKEILMKFKNSIKRGRR